jgi:hypothetical protein
LDIPLEVLSPLCAVRLGEVRNCLENHLPSDLGKGAGVAASRYRSRDAVFASEVYVVTFGEAPGEIERFDVVAQIWRGAINQPGVVEEN